MTVRPLIKVATLLLAVSSLTGCAVERPNIENCIVNAPNRNRKCYNFSKDYNDDGSLKAGAVPVYRANATIEDLNKAYVVDSDQGFPEALARLKAYIKKLRQHYEQGNCK